MALPAHYAMSGTGLGYGTTSTLRDVRAEPSPTTGTSNILVYGPIMCYAMSGTTLTFGPMTCYALSGPALASGAMLLRDARHRHSLWC
eukprot:271265-Rhodomonas_salina.4